MREKINRAKTRSKKKRAVRYQETEFQYLRNETVAVDADAKVVRDLMPRPCHKSVSVTAKLGIWLISRAVLLDFTSLSRFTPLKDGRANPPL